MLKDNKTKRYHKYVVVAMHLIKEAGGEMRVKDIYELLPKRFELTEKELSRTKSGDIRWRNNLSFYTVGSVKAGFLIKNKGVWIITPEGEAALQKGDEYYMEAAQLGYEKWANEHKALSCAETEEEIESHVANDTSSIKAEAEDSIRAFIASKNPYEFQFLVAALLRGMGFYTPFIAPKGRDGGVDIIAYRDPLGTIAPTLKVQVKHYPTSVISVDVVRSLVGILTKEDECGLVVTSGTFTSEAIREARHSHRRVRLIDIDELITLWLENYNKLSEEDKELLPIVRIPFLKSNFS